MNLNIKTKKDLWENKCDRIRFHAKNLPYGSKHLCLNLLRWRICLKPATEIVL